MSSQVDERNKSLPAPWDRIFALGTRLFVWGLLFGVIYLLRPFFLLIFLTFVFAYIQAHGVDGLAHRIRSRAARVWLVFVVFLGALLATGFFLAPRVKEQAEIFREEVPQHLENADAEFHRMREEGNWLAVMLAGPLESEQETSGDEAGGADGKAPEAQRPDDTGGEAQEPQKPEKPEPIVTNAVSHLLSIGTEGRPPDSESARADPQQRLAELERIFTSVLGITSSFLLALLFSFLIVLDLPKLSRGIASLSNTKVGFIYDEVAENIRSFGKVLGRALEAQLFIAIVNTILTATGIYFMELPNLVFLSAIVFLCSFIPVAGVFISSVPICLMALQVEHGGIELMLLAIALILVIHFIEAYFLNPKIFGHHLRMNPVLVLIVLTISGKLFGVWGLILGLPIVNYFFRHAIRYEPPDLDAHERAA